MHTARFHRLLLVSFALLLAVWASPAFAAPPEFTVINVDESDVFLDCGDFEVVQTVTGTIRISNRTTAKGTEIQISRYSLHETYTNSETGQSISTPDVGIDKITFNTDGSSTLVIVGLIGRIVVPREGLVAASAGRAVLYFSDPADIEPDVVFEAGPSDDVVGALCTALA
jgi:hypothetical protein